MPPPRPNFPRGILRAFSPPVSSPVGAPLANFAQQTLGPIVVASENPAEPIEVGGAPMQMVPFAAAPLLRRPPTYPPSIANPEPKYELLAVPKKKVSVSRRRIRNATKVIPFVKYVVKCRVCNKIKLPKMYCDKGCAIPGYKVGDEEQ
mmetsp:Transcript_38675/g.74162  ORF Transcript_38675/g.74162 Transcript_38675/m.74162 type:complete len:148 (+) Transcript_38675:70-513(+)